MAAKQNSIVFDAGPIISLTTNNLLGVLDKLKDDFKGEFYLPKTVKEELIDHPLATKKYKFEALQVNHKITKGTLTLISTPQISALAEELKKLANNTFKVRGSWLQLVHYGEMEALAAAILLNAGAVVIDERTTRLLVENQQLFIDMIERHMHSKVMINDVNLQRFKDWTKGLKIIRSVELVTVAYEKGHLDKYLLDGPNAKRTLIESLLWGVKLRGCSVTRDEINELVKIEQ
jgi:predicted nucleic acid-binding protein